MCNRYRMTANEAALAASFGVFVPPDHTMPGGELFPKRPGLVLRRDVEPLVTDTMSWGLPGPAAAKGPCTNIRNLGSSHWRNLLRDPCQRCLVPVTEFCEWSGEKGSKAEHWLSLRDRPVFAFAGLWRQFDGCTDASFGFLTCEPNPMVAAVHPKAMPVILHEEVHDRWLDGSMDDVRALAAPFPSQLMAMA